MSHLLPLTAAAAVAGCQLPTEVHCKVSQAGSKQCEVCGLLFSSQGHCGTCGGDRNSQECVPGVQVRIDVASDEQFVGRLVCPTRTND